MSRSRRRATNFDRSAKKFKQGTHRCLRANLRSAQLEEPLLNKYDLSKYNMHGKNSPYDSKRPIMMKIKEIINYQDKDWLRYISLHDLRNIQLFTNTRKRKTRDSRNKKIIHE